MTEDSYESAVRKLVRTKNGGEVTPGLFWDIVEALDKDLGKSDVAGKAAHKETMDTLSKHIRDEEKRLDGQAGRCAERHRALFAEEFSRNNNTHDVDTASARATLVREVAEAAAAKTLDLAAEKARGVVSKAEGVAGGVIHTAEETAAILADAGEEGDIKRAWRVVKWFVLAASIVVVNQLASMWFGK